MTRPTENEYRAAFQNKAYFTTCVERIQSLREDLLNELCDLQNDIKRYQDMIIEANDVILRYATYGEIEKG